MHTGAPGPLTRRYGAWKDATQLGGLPDRIFGAVRLAGRSVFQVISELIRLCKYEPQTGQSGKLDALWDDLEEALHPDQENAKVVVFSQWVETLKFLAERLGDHEPLIYHGSLGEKEREKVLEGFYGNGRLLLMSTRAGSRGLNLQHANCVFHFDRCWNPVPEMQAEGRCWRMGQKKTVFVYRYIAKGTIEERIDEVLCHKQQLFAQIIERLADDTDEAASHNWSLEELINLLRPQDQVGELPQLCTASSI